MENASGRAKRDAFSQKSRRVEQNAARFHGKCVRASKTPRVFAEIASGRAKRGACLQKSRRVEQNAARFHGKCVGSSKTSRVFTEITPWQAKRPACSRKMCQGGQNAATKPEAGSWGGSRSAMRCLPSFFRKPAYWRKVNASFTKQNSLSKALPCDSFSASQAGKILPHPIALRARTGALILRECAPRRERAAGFGVRGVGHPAGNGDEPCRAVMRAELRA